MKLFFVHGFGFNHRIWDGMRAHLGEFEQDCVDLGFTTEEPRHEELPAQDYIAIGHSLGVMWALKNANAHMKGLISIGGFDCYHRHIPADVIAGFRHRLLTDTENHMARFWRSGLSGDFCPISHLDLKRLAQAVDWLAQWDAGPELQKFQEPVLAIGLRKDKIVPPEMTAAIWEKRPGTKMIWHETGHHFLPATEPQWCAERIKDFAHDLRA